MRQNKPDLAIPLLTYAQAAILLGVKVSTLYSWVCRRRLPFIRLSGRGVRFDQLQLEAWLRTQSVSAASKTGPT